ncbi:MAG: acriflavin resistance protein [Sphingobacteriales bacterium SCN 48-20]|uniref:efflux RND transporter permease subunit n=1 Tax=Terrimonas ferruginea TaxID=249 RepID=UPI00086B2E74|nr:efflux RND transporter permease subunit [Terrimonas ferruginea]MBN8782852.1 efflux RND transporter permease subunit [Terrimonas ferruginea]ODT92783.1 MAG: acriflavin resistance protein [Sphingobacteriales bacterium SCN 48-20]OJW44050.1 MAG: acriflavin resistance protein [Sphingobacteriales bacterium 48-107]
MNISELSLRRPVFAIVMNIIIIVFGIIGYTFLGVRDYPAIDPPNINVRTSYAGANADIIESQITEPLEKAINGIAGIKNITSSSSQGSSNINVEFELGSDLETAANDVRDKVSQASRQLPNDLDAPPVVTKADASSDPILSMTVQSDTRNPLQITEYANNVLLERLQTIPGVSGIQIWGEKRYAMRIWMDPAKLSAFSVTPADVAQALAAQNVELPSGKIYGDATELTVRTFGRLNTEEEFNAIIVKNINGSDVKVKDIGSAVLGPENEESALRESGIPMIALAVIPQPGANYVEISNEFYKRVEQLKAEVPDDIKLNIALDQTRFIKKSISEVEETLLIALILVILIIYLFFRDAAIAFRPLIDIPVSLIGAFFIMYLAGFTINVLSLLAIVMATGLVVDDGIVVTENIYKKMEAGMNKWQAARDGSKEIYFAVISTSITLAVVFLPIIFLEGFVGRLFREFGVVVAGAVLISAFVSLTLTPVLNVKLTKGNKHKHSWFYTKTEPFFQGMENGYEKMLRAFMRVRWTAWLILGGCLVLTYLIFSNLKSELAPMEDRSQFRLQVTAPEGTSFDAMDKYLTNVTQFMLDSIPEKQVVLTITSPGFSGGSANSGMVRVTLSDAGDRDRSQQDIVNMVNRNMPRFNEARGSAIQDQTIQVNRRGGQPVQFVIQNNNFEKLTEVLPKFIDEASKSPVFRGQVVDADLKFNKPELRIEIDRLKASELGVTVADVSQTLQLALSNGRLGYFTKDGKQYQVMGQMSRADRDDPSDLKGIFVRNKNGVMISLDNLVTMTESTTPPTIYHFNRYKSATISTGLAAGYTIGDGVKEMQRIAQPLLDDTFATSLTGSSRDYAESGSNTSFAFLLALGLIFLILAAQFESFIDPIIIMITIILAMAGAVLSLWIFGHTWNIFSQIGMIMLIGLVTKNGILIVEFANQSRRSKGMEKKEAAIYAASQRLRPILMTSLAMALGALPLALSLGAAATSRIPLGVVIVGGISFSLIFTLFVVPAVYSFLSSAKKKNEMDSLPPETPASEVQNTAS